MPNGPQDQISEIFFPHATREANKAREHGIRFVHYSTADTAVKMLKYGEIWMRSASLMNDFMEIEHGWKCVESALKSEAGTRFKQALENVGHGQLAHQLTPGLGQWISSFRHQTFLTCFSEHGELRHVGPDEDPEDRFGRLSMWRAYGGQTGVAIIMKGTSFLTEQSAIDVFLSPVAYLSPQDLAPKMDEITAGVEANADFVRSRDHSEIRQVVFNLLRFAVIATKHPGFKEEREWRLIYSPQFTTPGANSALVTHAIETADP